LRATATWLHPRHTVPAPNSHPDPRERHDVRNRGRGHDVPAVAGKTGSCMGKSRVLSVAGKTGSYRVFTRAGG